MRLMKERKFKVEKVKKGKGHRDTFPRSIRYASVAPLRSTTFVPWTLAVVHMDVPSCEYETRWKTPILRNFVSFNLVRDSVVILSEVNRSSNVDKRG